MSSRPSFASSATICGTSVLWPAASHVVFDRHFGGFLGSLEERAHVDVESEVGVGGRDDFRAAVVPVLTEFSDHDAGLSTLLFGKLLGHLFGLRKTFVVFHFC